MQKWVLLFAIAYIVYRYWSGREAHRVSSKHSASVEQMLACEQCSLRIPESEAVFIEDKIFCSEQHYTAWKPGR